MQAKRTKRSISSFDFLLNSLEALPPDNGCLLWPYGVRSNGAGWLKDSSGRNITASRFVYELFNDELLPTTADIDQLCGNRGCFRPNHLTKRLRHLDYLLTTCRIHGTSSECLIWPAKPFDSYWCRLNDAGQQVSIQHCAYTRFIGAMPCGYYARPSCGNPQCYAISHLILVCDMAVQQTKLKSSRLPMSLEYIAGLFDAEGSVSNTKAHSMMFPAQISQKNPSVLYEIQAFLATYGITSTVYKAIDPDDTIHCHALSIYARYAAIEFYKLIAPHLQIKRTRAEDAWRLMVLYPNKRIRFNCYARRIRVGRWPKDKSV